MMVRKPTRENFSKAELIASLSDSERRKFFRSLTPAEAQRLLYQWRFWARKNQIPPEFEWRVWLILAGRGFGKTRTGAEWVRGEVEEGRRGRLALVGRTAADVRDVMVEGESGILAVSNPDFMPEYQPSKRRLVWPNGAIATTYAADEPDQLRGPQHDGAWGDEIASWKRPEALDNLFFGLRLGDDPRAVFTTTPRAVKHLKELLEDANTAVTRGSTYDNAANLPPLFLQKIIRKYEGTRIGRQEIHAEILEDNPNALWNRAILDETRWVAPRMPDGSRPSRKLPDMIRIVTGVDPGISEGEDAGETGIVVAGIAECSCKGVMEIHGFVMDDVSLQGKPLVWASQAVSSLYRFRGDKIVAERNQGGLMVEQTIRTVDENVPIKLVNASRGKYTRAEPIAALYEQKKVHHVGLFADLEDQMCNWVPGEDSPDRMDALVWALTELMLNETDQLFLV